MSKDRNPSPDAEQHGPPDNIKEKFREALEKKNQQHHHEDPESAHGDSKAHGEHGRAGHDKTFRRKSG